MTLLQVTWNGNAEGIVTYGYNTFYAEKGMDQK